MIRAIVLCVMLIGCASANKKDTHSLGDWDRDGCIAVRCESYCKENATPEQIKKFHEGVIDDKEKEALRRFGWGLGADTVTTAVGFGVCSNIAESNPILGASPNPLVVAAFSGVSYWVAYQDAKNSPYWCSSARWINTASIIRTVASINNIAVIAGCNK